MNSAKLAKLTELVSRFKNNWESYHRPQFNETQTRREFIDPLFELLGWDVANNEGFAEAYKHVVHEDRVRVGGKSKAPDYSFRVGGVRKFFLEAKKPSVDILNDKESAFQIRRYAWSAKLSLSILTNFEFIAVYDCRRKPSANEKASTGRIMQFSYDELAERWEELSSRFSLTAIQKGAFDCYAEEAKNFKGTDTVDDDFLHQIEGWREVLAKSFARKNRSLDTYGLNDAVQKTIDRIVFLRIAEDRGIETYGRLLGAAKTKNIYRRLCVYFQDADKRYNSGLFHFNESEGDRETLDKTTLSLALEDKPIRDIITNLYPPNCPYEFSVIPADILGQIYEKFLGKTIKLSSRKIEIDEKPEVKKAGGVYYTPSYVVRYIVKSVLNPLLAGKSPPDVGGQKKGKHPVRIIDPACGSGSFLIEVYQALLDWYLENYLKSDKSRDKRGASARIYQATTGEWRLTIAEKKRILITHVFGVDVDSRAVEVTKLSLLLKVLEGESSDIVASQIDFLSNQRVLPDLGKNIKCGNSIISPKFYGLYDPSDLAEEQLHKINVFSWQKSFPESFANKGFDAVVGNPPYGATLLPEEKAFLLAEFDWQSYQLDSYLIFLEQSLRQLLRPKGYLGVIIPNPWLTNLRQNQFRKRVFENSSVLEIIHFTFNVFKRAKATVDTQIVLLQNGSTKKFKPTSYIISEIGSTDSIDLTLGKRIAHDQDSWIENSDLPVNIFMDANERKLATKMRAVGTELTLIFNSSVGMKPYQTGKGRPKQNKIDVESRKFDSSTKKSTDYRQYIRGKDIGRFQIQPLEKRYIRYGEWLAEPRASAGFDTSPKIVMRQTGDSLVAAKDTNKLLCMNNMHVLTARNSDTDLDFYIGLLNSKAINWYYQTLNPEIGEALAEVKKANVDRLPMPKCEDKIAREIARLSKRIEKNIAKIAYESERSRSITLGIIESDFEQLNNIVMDAFEFSKAERSIINRSQQSHNVI